MFVEKVWLRFEKKKKDGTVWKLRIQDVPPARLDEVIDLQTNYFPRDAVVNKAVGVSKNPEAVQEYKEYVSMIVHDPACRAVICCEDNGEEVRDIIGISLATVGKKISWGKMSKEKVTVEKEKLIEMLNTVSEMYSAVKASNPGSYLHGVSILVMPNYRGYGIAQQFLRTRRLMCAELNISMTAAWMTGFGSQVAAEKDGWKTKFEVKYDELAQRHNLVFQDAPPTIKYMVAGPSEEIVIHQINMST